MNTVFILSLVMALAGCTGLFLAGKGMWQGWAIGLAVQPVWAVFAILTEGYGLLITSIMYVVVYTKILIKMRREKKFSEKYKTAIELGIMSTNEARLADKPIHTLINNFKNERVKLWCESHRRPYTVCEDFDAFNVDRVNSKICNTREL